MRCYFGYCWVVSVALTLVVTTVVSANAPNQSPEIEQEEFREIAGQLRCPTCTGLSVLDSDASFSVQIQNIVKEKLQEGKSEKEILEFFTLRYGPWILREPPKEGFDLIAWLFPIALMIFGPMLVWLLVWRRSKERQSQQHVVVLRSVEEILEEFERALITEKGSIT
jgi:cytochrome c-type biogenesis protein CcmH/NrfF